MRAMISGVDRQGRPDPNGKRFLFVTLAGNVVPPGTPPALAHCDTDGNSRLFPAVLGPGIDGLITVGGATPEKRYWVGSCGGPAVELLAPAKGIDVATITGRDHYRSGTSYAAPYVAGLAALLLEQDPTLTPPQIETRLKESASYTTDHLEAPAGGRLAAPHAETISTRCQTEEVTYSAQTTVLRMVGCGEEFADNVLWHLDRADSAEGALDGKSTRIATGRGALVYLVDTGVMQAHDEFARATGPNVIDGFQMTNPFTCSTQALSPCTENLSDSLLFIFTHGTATASVVGGIRTGLAPDANIVSVALQSNDIADWIRSFDEIIRHAWSPATPSVRTAVVNMSTVPGYMATDERYAALERKMREMIGGVDVEGRPDPNGKRFLFVTIAGNKAPEGTRPEFSQCQSDGASRLYPSAIGWSIDGLITVGGIDQENRFWSGSCGGEGVDILAPAANLLVASMTGRDHYRGGRPVNGVSGNSGTSYAAPYVAGLAALLLERDPDLTPQQIESRLKATASYTSDRETAPAAGRVAIFDIVSTYPRRRVVRR
jgi:subtilisin family serine protease